MILGVIVFAIGFVLAAFGMIDGSEGNVGAHAVLVMIGLVFLIAGGALFCRSDSDYMTYKQSSDEVILKAELENTFKLKDDEIGYAIKFSCDNSSFTAEMSKSEYEALLGNVDSIKSKIYTLTCIDENGHTTTLKRYSFLGEKDFSSTDKDSIKKILNGDGTYDTKLESLKKFVKSKGQVIAE